MISAENLGGLLFGIHSHAEIENDIDPEQIVYREEDIIKLLKKLGFPEPVWGKSIDIDSYDPT